MMTRAHKDNDNDDDDENKDNDGEEDVDDDDDGYDDGYYDDDDYNDNDTWCHPNRNRCVGRLHPFTKITYNIINLCDYR